MEDRRRLGQKDINQISGFIEQHRNREIEREIDFINAFKNDYKNYLNFELPNKINATLIVQFDYKRNKQLFETKPYYYLMALEEFILRRKSNQNLSAYQIFITEFVFLGISNVFSEYYKYSSPIPYEIDIVFSEVDLVFNQYYLDLLNQILEYLLNFSNGFDYLHMKFSSLKKIISFLDNYVKENDNMALVDPTTFQFQIREERGQEKFFTFYTLYKETFFSDSYLNFDWADRSTGEKALLNIYSRLYSLSDDEQTRVASNLVLRNDVMILVDEGELYLHPTWQKEILFQLLKILPIIFKRSSRNGMNIPRNIQILLASNSPLLITDIPANNIVFLKKNLGLDKKVVVQDSLNDQKQTFAANIHTLLSDSFFMTSGLMGDFAFYRINQVIKILMSSKEVIELNKEMVQKVIMMIGEPIIKSKLMQMLNERLSLDMIDLNSRVSELEMQVAQLKKRN